MVKINEYLLVPIRVRYVDLHKPIFSYYFKKMFFLFVLY